MYKVSEEFYLRVPFEPFYISYLEDNIIEYCKQKSMENIVINSKSLYDTICNGNGNKDDQRLSLTKYLNRSSTRTTPYGLNAFVSIGRFNKDNVNIFDKNNLSKNLLLDYEWIVNFIKKIEVELDTNLNVTISNTIELTDELVVNKWIDCFHENKKYNSKYCLINRKKPFNIIKNVLNGKFKSINTLITAIKQEYKEVDDKIIYQYIMNLLNNGFLISDLKFTTLEERSLDNLLHLLGKYNNLLQEYLEELMKVRKYIEQYNSSKVQDGTKKYVKIIETLQNICTSNNYVSVDLYYRNFINFDYKIRDDVNEFVGLLARFSQQDYSLKDYCMKFIEKYNLNLVPILDVFDENKGIGLPIKKRIQNNEFNNYIYKLNHNTIDLSDIDLSLSPSEQDYSLTVDGFELSLNIINRDGEYLYIVTPLIGSDSLYKSLGRFYKLKEKVDNRINCNVDNVELCYFPKNARIANVLNCYSESHYYLEYGSNTSLSDKERLELADIYLCPIDGILKFVNGRTGNIINFTVNNMTNLMYAPDIIKGMLLVQQSSKKNMLYLFEQIHETFKNSFISPRIIYKNFVIKPFEIKLKKDDIGAFGIDSYINRIQSLMEKYNITGRVYCGSEDNYLLLDLSKASNMQILKKQLLSKGYLNIRESYFNESNLILYEENNVNKKYINEVVFQISPSFDDGKVHEIDKNICIHKSTKDWISIKLYMKDIFMDYFIINYMDKFIQEIFGNNNEWFYIRYKDPQSHLRIRIRLNKQLNISYSKLKELLFNYEKQNLIDYCIIDEYFPEINRYGGDKLINKVEELFHESSLVSKKLIEESYLDYEFRKTIYSIWIFITLKSIEEYCDVEKILEIYKKYYQRNSDVNKLRRTMISNCIKFQYDEHFIMVKKVSENFVEKLVVLMPEIIKEKNCNDILLSLMHMNFNRTMGINRDEENRTMSNIENVYYSLNKILVKEGNG